MVADAELSVAYSGSIARQNRTKKYLLYVH